MSSLPTMAKKRLMRDFKILQQDPPHGVSGAPVNNNIMRWQAYIFGPEDTIWEGGIFHLDLVFPEEYPNKPPQVTFLSKIFHPNVYRDGTICLDILQSQWCPVYGVAGILTSIRSLLSDPNPLSPANNHAAQLYIENRQEYNNQVAACVSDAWRLTRFPNDSASNAGAAPSGSSAACSPTGRLGEALAAASVSSSASPPSSTSSSSSSSSSTAASSFYAAPANGSGGTVSVASPPPRPA